MQDRIEKLGHSVIQHGKANDRIYLMKLARCDLPHIRKDLELLAEEKGYGKIFCKVPAWARKPFEQSAYQEEAEIPNYYQGRTDLIFYSRFRNEARRYRNPKRKSRVEEILKTVKKQRDKSAFSTPTFEIRPLSESDSEALADLYREVFDSYPFPIFDADYLIETMQSHADYFGAFELGRGSGEEGEVKLDVKQMYTYSTLWDYENRFLFMLLDLPKQCRGKQISFTVDR